MIIFNRFQIFSIIFLFSCSALYTQPKFILNAYGGLSLPMMELKGEVAAVPVATTFEKDYGMRLGVNFGINGKYAFDKKGSFRGVLGFDYNLMMNPGEYVSAAGSYKYNPQIGIATIFLGAEYAFSPKQKVNPFAGLDITANLFSGSFNYDPKFPTIPDISLKSSARFGIQFNLGAEWKAGKTIGVVFGGKYNLTNILGKDSDTSTFSQVLTSERPLNDKEYTYAGKTVSAKNIAYLQFYAGVCFFFGEPEKKKK